MDNIEKGHIRNNLTHLCEDTFCSTQLLAYLFQYQILNEIERQQIRSLPTNYDKSMELYRIVQTRTNGYNALTAALRNTEQSGVLKILLKLKSSPNESSQSGSNGSTVEQQLLNRENPIGSQNQINFHHLSEGQGSRRNLTNPLYLNSNSCIKLKCLEDFFEYLKRYKYYVAVGVLLVVGLVVFYLWFQNRESKPVIERPTVIRNS